MSKVMELEFREMKRSEIRQAAESAGFKSARAYGEMSFIKPKKNSERIYICLRK